MYHSRRPRPGRRPGRPPLQPRRSGRPLPMRRRPSRSHDALPHHEQLRAAPLPSPSTPHPHHTTPHPQHSHSTATDSSSGGLPTEPAPPKVCLRHGNYYGVREEISSRGTERDSWRWDSSLSNSRVGGGNVSSRPVAEKRFGRMASSSFRMVQLFCSFTRFITAWCSCV